MRITKTRMIANYFPSVNAYYIFPVGVIRPSESLISYIGTENIPFIDLDNTYPLNGNSSWLIGPIPEDKANLCAHYADVSTLSVSPDNCVETQHISICKNAKMRSDMIDDLFELIKMYIVVVNLKEGYNGVFRKSA